MLTRAFSSLALLGVLLASCSAGDDAVVSGGQFEFVAPGGQTTIRYEPPEQRRTVGQLAGESLMDPGRQIRLSDYAGKVVVLNVWGSWCGPCRLEMPEMQEVFEKTSASGVQVLGIDVRDPSRDAPMDFVRNVGVSYPSIYDPPGRSLLALRGYPHNVVPSTIVLDRRHRVAVVFLKPLLAEDLLPVVRRLAVEEKPKDA